MASIKADERAKGTVWRVRIYLPGGGMDNTTWPTEAAALAYVKRMEAEKVTGRLPEDFAGGKVKFGAYAAEWMATRQLRDRTREGYDDLLKRFILPELKNVALKGITAARVRKWHAALLRADEKAKRSHNQTAKSYRLLRTILNTAVADGALAKNPCAIRGAGIEDPDERPILEVAEVEALAAAIEPHLRALVMTAAYAGLRRGELLALRRRDVDLLHGTLPVRKQVDRAGRESDPKTRAGKRTRPLPGFLVDELTAHLDQWTPPEKDARVFVGVQGGPLSTLVLNLAFKAAREKVGLERVTLHDLRHFSGTYFAQMGATTREIMGHLGHASPAAAMRYQHDAASRGQELAKRMDAAVRAAREVPDADVVEIGTVAKTSRKR